jgi:hypothetical protein
MWPGSPYASSFGQAPQAAGGGVAVHPCAAAVEQDRPAGAGADRAVDGPPDSWRERGQHDLGAFAAHAQHPVTVSFAESSSRTVRSGPAIAESRATIARLCPRSHIALAELSSAAWAL